MINGIYKNNLKCDFSDAENVYFAIGNSDQTTLADVKTIFDNFNIMVTRNQSSTYEKYTGRMESPSVKYPSKIEIIDGCNRFDKNDVTANAMLEVDTGEVVEASSTLCVSNFIPVEADKPVYLSDRGTSRTMLYDKNKKFLNKASKEGGKTVITPTQDGYIRMTINLSSVNIDEVQLTEGTEEKPYLPYNSIGLKFSGKNFLKLQDGTYTNNGITCVVSDGVITANGTASINTVCNIPINEITLNGTYILSSFNTIENANVQARLDGDSETYYNLENANATHTFTKNENIKYTKYVFRTTGGTTLNNFIVKPMLSVDVGDYEPYHEPKIVEIDLNGNSIAKVNDSIKDELEIYRNGKITLKKKVNRYSFSENEKIEKNTNYSIDSMLVVQFNKSDMKVGTTNILCNYFKYSSNTIINSIRAAGDYILFGLDKATFTDVDSFKSYLLQQYENETAVYVDYELATLQQIELPDIAPIELWEGTVNVELISNLSTNMNVNYNIVPAMPSLEAESEVSSIDNVNIRICNENLAYEGWAEDFVSRINNSGRASIATKDGRKCLLYSPDAGYNDYDNKYLFKTNWKENVQYTFKFDAYLLNKNGYANLCLQYTDGTEQELSNLKTNEWNKVNFKSKASKTIKYLRVNWRSESTYIDLDTFMVYEGPEMPQFIQNQTNKLQMVLDKPLRGIKTDKSIANYVDENGDYWICDYISDDGIHRKIGKETINITSQLFTLSNGNKVALITPTNKWKTYITGVKTSMFTKAIYADRASKDFGLTGTYYENEGNFIIVGDKNDTVETMQEKYDGETLLYILNEEIIEEFTEEEKKSWNEFKKMKTFKGKNYISSVDNIQAGIEFTYKKDNRISTQKELDKCNERLSNIEQLLSTTETSSLLLDNLENDLKKEVE